MPSPHPDRSPLDSIGRRQVLRTAGSVAALGLAGCTGVLRPDPDSYEYHQEDFDPPILPYDQTYPDDDGVSMFRGGLRRLGYYPEETVPDSVTVNWSLPVNYRGHNAAKASPLPTPDGETIVIPADTGRLHGVSPKGEYRWTAETPATRQGFHATPVIVDGVAYIGGYDGANRFQDAAMYAFDVESGERLWRTEEMSGSVAIGSSAGYWEGYLYVVVEHRRPRERGELWVFDAETGETLWVDDRIDEMPHPTVAIDPVHERLLTGSNDGVLYCWEFPSLEFAWEFPTGGALKGPIATYDGSAFFGSWDHHFYRVALEDGQKEWDFEAGAIVMSAPAIDPEEGVVYFGSDDWHVYAVDAETGEERWSTDVQGRVMSAVSVTADAVLAGTNGRDLCALEKDTGEMRWWVPNRGHVTSEAVPRDGRIYYAERAHIPDWFDLGDDAEVVAPGHAYCLVADE